MKLTYQQSLIEKDPNKKGKLFELFVKKFFENIQGFELEMRYNIKETDIDVLIINKRTDFFRDWGLYIPVQCKNICKKIDKNIINQVYDQAKIFGRFTKMAILATTSSLSKSAKSQLREINRQGEIFLVVIDKHDWEKFFNNKKMTPEKFFFEIIKNTPKKYM